MWSRTIFSPGNCWIKAVAAASMSSFLGRSLNKKQVIYLYATKHANHNLGNMLNSMFHLIGFDAIYGDAPVQI